ncbi:hypothetical protein OGATHE_004410 [Ogataea polymorpha]|uniref:Uncharacterized protein n=1 Tax=Ogataea polymorpha TaxID=460523 RepID=A0A9P8P1A5_9ASCO|nr:hypothetical protein OGATHE_004410 [Ogataea polymorpha]
MVEFEVIERESATAFNLKELREESSGIRWSVELDASAGRKTGMLVSLGLWPESSSVVSAVKKVRILDWYEKLRLSERPREFENVDSDRLSGDTGLLSAGSGSVSWSWMTISDSSCHLLRFHELMERLSPSS